MKTNHTQPIHQQPLLSELMKQHNFQDSMRFFPVEHLPYESHSNRVNLPVLASEAIASGDLYMKRNTISTELLVINYDQLYECELKQYLLIPD